jgi:hypothetical protein
MSLQDPPTTQHTSSIIALALRLVGSGLDRQETWELLLHLVTHILLTLLPLLTPQLQNPSIFLVHVLLVPWLRLPPFYHQAPQSFHIITRAQLLGKVVLVKFERLKGKKTIVGLH